MLLDPERGLVFVIKCPDANALRGTVGWGGDISFLARWPNTRVADAKGNQLW